MEKKLRGGRRKREGCPKGGGHVLERCNDRMSCSLGLYTGYAMRRAGEGSGVEGEKRLIVHQGPVKKRETPKR